MNKLNLKSVTLLACTTRDHIETILALQHCMRLIDFNNVIYFSDINPKIENIHWIYCPKFINYCDVCIWFMTSIFKYTKFFSDHILSIHFDGYPININAWCADFLKYDFIGAVWKWKIPVVGNNGFCIYSKNFLSNIEKLQLTPTENDCHPSDLILLQNRHLLGEVAPVELAHQFATEGFRWDEYRSFGFHGLYNLAGAHLVEPYVQVPKEHQHYLFCEDWHRYTPKSKK